MLRPILFGHFHELHELENDARTKFRPSLLREYIKILVIDDEDFAQKEALQMAKFNVTQIKNVEDLRCAADYQIIICDIKGVGAKFGSKNEGAFVINEIKKLYPYRQYAVYSGSAFTQEMSALLKDIETIKKDAGIEEWISYMDEFIDRTCNPVYIWKEIRRQLFLKNASTLSVLKLEDEYVRLMQNNPSRLKDFPSKNKNPDLSEDIFDVVKNLIAGVLLALAHIQ